MSDARSLDACIGTVTTSGVWGLIYLATFMVTQIGKYLSFSIGMLRGKRFMVWLEEEMLLSTIKN